MGTIETRGQFVDLDNREMVEINGGSAVGEVVAKVAGFIFGTIAKLQEKNGDTGQWLA
jgi:hypothetical protein